MKFIIVLVFCFVAALAAPLIDDVTVLANNLANEDSDGYNLA